MIKIIVGGAIVLPAALINLAPNSSNAQTKNETDATPIGNDTVVFYRPNSADFATAKGCLAYISNRQSDGAYWKACFWGGNWHFFHIGKDINYQHWAQDTPVSYIFDSSTHEEGAGYSIEPPDVQTISESYPAPGYARIHPGYYSILKGDNPQPGKARWASVDGVARYANSPEGIDTIVRATYGPNGDGVLRPDALDNFKRWAAQYRMNENLVREVERKVNKRSAAQGKDLNR